MKKVIKFLSIVLAGSALTFLSCNDLEDDRPALGDFPEDINAPGGPLKFFVAFDGETTNTLMNAVDSIKASFPSENPFTIIPGVSGNAVQGVPSTYVKYPKFNDWANFGSVTISFWSKGTSPTIGNEGGNSPEHVISFPAVDNYFHWSGSVMMLFLESNATGCQVKWMVVDKDHNDSWFTWEGGDAIPGILDGEWHHYVLKYDETTSTASLYIDGVMNPATRAWTLGSGPHGALALDADGIKEARVGKGPKDSEGNDWQSGTLQRGLDQLRLYGIALSDADINKLFTERK